MKNLAAALIFAALLAVAQAQVIAPLGPGSGGGGGGGGGGSVAVPGTVGQIVTANGTSGFGTSITPSISGGCGNYIGGGSIGDSLVGALPSTLQPVTSGANGVIPNSACGQLWQASSTGNLTWTLPQAGSTGYGNNWYSTLCNINTGSLTIVTSGGTIGGASSYSITSGSQLAPGCIGVASDNVSNYALIAGGGSGSTSLVGGTTPISNVTSGDVLVASNGKVADSNFPSASIASLTAQDQTLTGGANAVTVNLGTPTSGSTLTVDCGKGPYQAFLNNVLGFTLAAPATVSASGCVLLMTNGSAAGTVLFSGWSEGATSGDALTTTSGANFGFFVTKITGFGGAKSHYLISAYQ